MKINKCCLTNRTVGRGHMVGSGILLLFLFYSMIFLVGCQLKELEEREFPLTVSFDLSNQEEIESIFTFSDVAMVTQSDMSIEREEIDQLPKLTGKTMDDILELHYRSSEKYLDLGHVQAIILGKALITNQDTFKEILLYLESNEVFARNVLLFIADKSTDEVMKVNGVSVDSLGAYLGEIYKNNPYLDKKESVTLGDLLNYWHNGEERLAVPIISIINEKPVIASYGNFEYFEYKGE